MKKEMIDMLEKATYEELLEVKNIANSLIIKKEEVIDKLKNTASKLDNFCPNTQPNKFTKKEMEKFVPFKFVCLSCGSIGIHFSYEGFDDFDDLETCYTIYKCNNDDCEQEYQLYVNNDPNGGGEYDMPKPYVSKNCKKSKEKKRWLW